MKLPVAIVALLLATGTALPLAATDPSAPVEMVQYRPMHRQERSVQYVDLVYLSIIDRSHGKSNSSLLDLLSKLISYIFSKLFGIIKQGMIKSVW